METLKGKAAAMAPAVAPPPPPLTAPSQSPSSGSGHLATGGEAAGGAGGPGDGGMLGLDGLLDAVASAPLPPAQSMGALVAQVSARATNAQPHQQPALPVGVVEELKVVKALCENLEARVRELEANLYYTVILKADLAAVTDTIALAKAYGAAVKADPYGHGLGPPAPILALAFFQGMCRMGLPVSSDDGLKSRYIGMAMLTMLMMSQDAPAMTAWFTHFAISFNFEGVNQAPTHAKVSFRCQGTMSLPITPAEMAASVMIVDNAWQGLENSLAPLEDLRNKCFTMEDLVPVATAAKQFNIMNVLRSYLCGVGGTVCTTRAAAGPLVRKLRHRGGGGGRGGKGNGT